MARSAVNNGMRALEGLLARFFNDSIEPTIDSTGSANAYVFAANRTLAAYYDGMRISFHANFANTGAATLDVDSVGAKSIVKNHDIALVSGDIEANQVVEVVYSATDDTWQMVSNPAQFYVSATDTAEGVLETATAAEMVTGTAVDKIVTPGRVGFGFVSTAAFTAATTISVTGLVAGHDYIFQLQNFAPTTDAESLMMRLSDDAGVSWEADAGDYDWGFSEGGSPTSDDSDTRILLSGGGFGNDAGNKSAFEVIVMDPNTAGENTTALWNGAVENTAATPVKVAVNGSGTYISATDAHDGVQFLWSGGSTFKAQGNLTVWRRKRS